MPGRRRRTRWEGGGLCWEASGQEAAYQVLLNEPRTAHAVPLPHGHSFHQLWGPLHQAGVPCAWVRGVHASSSMQAAMQRVVAAPAPASAEDFEEQTAEGSNQRWAAISTWETTARQCIAYMRALQIMMHLIWRANLSTLCIFQAAFKGISRAVSSVKGIEEWGAWVYWGMCLHMSRSVTLVPDIAQWANSH